MFTCHFNFFGYGKSLLTFLSIWNMIKRFYFSKFLLISKMYLCSKFPSIHMFQWLPVERIFFQLGLWSLLRTNWLVFYIFWLRCNRRNYFPILQAYAIKCFFILSDIFMVSFVAFTFLIHLECIYVLGLFLAPLPQNERVLPSNLHWGWSSASFEAGGGVGGGDRCTRVDGNLRALPSYTISDDTIGPFTRPSPWTRTNLTGNFTSLLENKGSVRVA